MTAKYIIPFKCAPVYHEVLTRDKHSEWFRHIECFLKDSSNDKKAIRDHFPTKDGELVDPITDVTVNLTNPAALIKTDRYTCSGIQDKEVVTIYNMTVNDKSLWNIDYIAVSRIAGILDRNEDSIPEKYEISGVLGVELSPFGSKLYEALLAIYEKDTYADWEWCIENVNKECAAKLYNLTHGCCFFSKPYKLEDEKVWLTDDVSLPDDQFKQLEKDCYFIEVPNDQIEK